MTRRYRRPPAKAAPRRAAATSFRLATIRFPNESRQYWLAVGLLTWGCVLLAVGGWLFTGKHYWQWGYLAAWPLGSLLLVNLLADLPRRRQLRQVGASARVLGTTQPELYQRLTRLCELLGVHPVPELYLVEDPDAYLYSRAGGRGSLVLTRSLLDLLSPAELSLMLARELAHLALGHVRLERALTYLRTQNTLICVFFGPVWVWSVLMGEWLDLIDYTADRAALLAVGNPALVNATLVKVAAVGDPLSGVSLADIENLRRGGPSDALDVADMERRFKLNRLLDSQPNLRDRVEALVEYQQSEEGRQALTELAPARARLGL